MEEIRESHDHSTLEVASQPDRPILVKTNQETYSPGPYYHGLHLDVASTAPELARYRESMAQAGMTVGRPDQKKLKGRRWSWIILGLVVLVVVGGTVGGVVGGLKKNHHSNSSPAGKPANNATNYGLFILSASYGNLDVKAQLNQLFTNNTSTPTTNQFNFTPSSTLFGHDPLPGNRKAVTVVYQISNISPGQPPVHGPPQVYRGLDGDAVSINYATTVQSYVPPCPPSNRYIIDATWYNQDVTSTVSSLSGAALNGTLSIKVDVSTLGTDPAIGTLKQFTVTFSEVDASGTTQYYTKIGKDQDIIQIPRGPPPTLKIFGVNFGGQDVTSKALNLTTAQQTWQINSSNSDLIFGDPWVGADKSICILYQYGTRPMELLVAGEYDGLLSLDPFVPVDPRRTLFIRPNEPRILAMIWGVMQNQTGPVPEDKFQAASSSGSFTCSNDWFGFDGWPENSKSCVVYAKDGAGKIYDTGAKEGALLTL